jgi:hypothetical protein
VVIRREFTFVAPGLIGVATADCEPGEKATGGGFSAAGAEVIFAGPDNVTGTPTGWRLNAQNQLDSEMLIHVYAICAS